MCASCDEQFMKDMEVNSLDCGKCGDRVYRGQPHFLEDDKLVHCACPEVRQNIPPPATPERAGPPAYSLRDPTWRVK